MTDSTCTCTRKFNCIFLAIIASLIIGTITAILTITATLAIPAVLFWIFFGIAIAFLVLLLLIGAFGDCTARGCTTASFAPLLTGIFGTLLTSLVLITVDFGGAGIISAIITGALLAFFSLIVTTIACLISCFTAHCND